MSKGFTLIELMIVVSIIAILAAIIIPACTNKENQSTTEQAESRGQEVMQPTPAPEVSPTYVNSLRLSERPVELRQHQLSGVLYACFMDDNKCHKVTQY